MKTRGVGVRGAEQLRGITGYTLVLRDTIMRNCYTCPVEQGRLFLSRPHTVIVRERVDVASRWRRLFPGTNLNYNCF